MTSKPCALISSAVVNIESLIVLYLLPDIDAWRVGAGRTINIGATSSWLQTSISGMWCSKSALLEHIYMYVFLVTYRYLIFEVQISQDIIKFKKIVKSTM